MRSVPPWGAPPQSRLPLLRHRVSTTGFPFTVLTSPFKHARRSAARCASSFPLPRAVDAPVRLTHDTRTELRCAPVAVASWLLLGFGRSHPKANLTYLALLCVLAPRAVFLPPRSCARAVVKGSEPSSSARCRSRRSSGCALPHHRHLHPCALCCRLPCCRRVHLAHAALHTAESISTESAPPPSTPRVRRRHRQLASSRPTLPPSPPPP
jgi:hypothetical protein